MTAITKPVSRWKGRTLVHPLKKNERVVAEAPAGVYVASYWTGTPPSMVADHDDLRFIHFGEPQ